MGKSIPRTGIRSSGESRRRSTDPAAALAAFKERLFQGSTRMLLARLVEDEEISVEELERLRQEVRARRDGGGR